MSPYQKIKTHIKIAEKNKRSLNETETLTVLKYLSDLTDKPVLLKKIIHLIVVFKREEQILKNLTKRELHIFKLIGCNFTTIEIANHLSISENTVITHRKNIINKLKLKGTRRLKSCANVYMEKELRKS